MTLSALKYWLIFLFVILLACNSNKPKKPDNLIPEPLMVDILVDLALLDAATGYKKNVLKEHGVSENNHVYNKYKIDSIQFSLSNNYYAYDIKKYQNIYNKVEAKLEAKKTLYRKLDQEERRERKRKDSLRRLQQKINDSLGPDHKDYKELKRLIKKHDTLPL